MNTSLPVRLKLIRNGMPQAEFAALVGLHKSSWGRFERGDSEPSSSDLKSVCSILNRSAGWLHF
ncbi:MAG TPA: helix-turn-helix domain-containing protein [Candidatus Mailhella excrementigallinarum]|nr:helix-turn-helix domain-containing protein [Candidatus Mailhella excrementigallinarum]